MSEEKHLVDLVFVALLVWHVSSVATWVGSCYYYIASVWPYLRLLTLDERSSRLRSFFPHFSQVICSAAVSALLAGTILMGYVTSGDTSLYPAGWRLVFVSIGAVLGLVGGFLTLGVILPMGTRIMKTNSTLALPVEEGTKGRVMTGMQDYGATLRSIVSPLAVVLSLTVVMMVLGMFV